MLIRDEFLLFYWNVLCKGGYMKVLKCVVLGLLLMSVLSVLGCGPAAANVKETTVEKVYRPVWWDNQDPASPYLNVYGMGTATYEESSIDIAKSNAWSEASQYVQVYVDGMIKRYLRESGVDNPQILQSSEKATQVVTSSEFSGVMTVKSETIKEDGKYRTFIALAIPKDDVNKKILDAIKNEEALYTEFKASQAFQELERIVKDKNAAE